MSEIVDNSNVVDETSQIDALVETETVDISGNEIQSTDELVATSADVTTTSIEDYISHLENALGSADKSVSNLLIGSSHAINVNGMLSNKIRHFYNNLLSFTDSRAIEVGVYNGASTCALLHNNSADLVSFDDWSDFIAATVYNIPKKPRIANALENINKCIGRNKFEFKNENCFTTDLSLLGKRNMLIFDGNTKFDDVYNSIKYFHDIMDTTFIYVTDDWNFERVRRGVNTAINDLNLTVEWSREYRLTQDNSHTPEELAKKSWWNGLYVGVFTKNV